MSHSIIYILRVLITFLLVSLAWVFFRAESVQKAFSILLKIKNISFFDTVDLKLNNSELIFSFLLILGLLIVDKNSTHIRIRSNYTFIIFIVLLALSCYFFGIFDNKQFIYFQF